MDDTYSTYSRKAFRGVLSRPYLQKETARQYHSLKEEDVLELLEQAEDGSDSILLNEPDELPTKPPKPLSSMPSAKPATKNADAPESQAKVHTRPYSSANDRLRTEPIVSLGRRKGLSKSMSSLVIETKTDDNILSSCLCGNVIELTKQSLEALSNMKIKFPGKSNEEAAELLHSIIENWKYHKPKVASYWLVKLDSSKRRKVIDIVKGNVRAILQRVWKLPDIESLRLCRIFNKIFNRLVANHGQGLWNCFSSNGDSWESFISRSTESVTQLEMNCCRRVVQLCKECLLVVYEFASQSEAAELYRSQTSTFTAEPFAINSNHPISGRYSMRNHRLSGRRMSNILQRVDRR